MKIFKQINYRLNLTEYFNYKISELFQRFLNYFKDFIRDFKDFIRDFKDFIRDFKDFIRDSKDFWIILNTYDQDESLKFRSTNENF